jgi:hypothetical protein
MRPIHCKTGNLIARIVTKSGIGNFSHLTDAVNDQLFRHFNLDDGNARIWILIRSSEE